jgi:SPX domain protein involved in polyphosphate accumulation
MDDSETLATLSAQNTGRRQSKLTKTTQKFWKCPDNVVFFVHFILTLITAGITETND